MWDLLDRCEIFYKITKNVRNSLLVRLTLLCHDFVVVVRSHEPSLTQNVTAAPITTIAPHQVSSKFETSSYC